MPATTPPVAVANPRGPSKIANVSLKDVEIVKRCLGDLGALLRAYTKGDPALVAEVYPKLKTLAKDAERIRFVARRAMARREEPKGAA